MIAIETYRKFCSTDATRPHLCEPWIEGLNGIGDIYATDGRVLLSVAVSEVAGACDWSRQTEEAPPETEKMWRKFDYVVEAEAPVDLTSLSFRIAERTCPECAGEKAIECGCPDCEKKEHPCRECLGAGMVAGYEPRTLSIFGRTVDTRLVAKLSRLPDVRFYDWNNGFDPEARFSEALIFRFGETGQGILQPLIPDKTA